MSIMTTDTLALLSAAAKPKAAKSTATTPCFSQPEKADALKRLLELKRQKKDLEAEEKMLQADLLPVAEQIRTEASKAAGENLPSIKLNGVSYVCQCRYSAISKPEQYESCKEVEVKAGVPAGTYFKEKFGISVDPLKLPAELLSALIQIGAEVIRQYDVTRAFHDDRVLKPTVAGLAATLEVKPVSFFKE